MPSVPESRMERSMAGEPASRWRHQWQQLANPVDWDGFGIGHCRRSASPDKAKSELVLYLSSQYKEVALAVAFFCHL